MNTLEFPRLFQHSTYVIASLLMAASTSGPVDAQEPQRGDTVRDRPRLDYDSFGVRAGSFLIFPVIDAELRYDDNIYRENYGEEGDFITSIRPGFHAASQWSNHELRIDAGVDADDFADKDEENSTDWFAAATARLDITRDARLQLSLRMEELHEDRSNPNSATYVLSGPVSYNRQDAGLDAFYRLNRLSLTAEGNFAALSYDDMPSVGGDTFRQRDRDREEIELTVRTGYEIVPEYEAFLRVTRNERTYERPQRRIGSHFRDSRGWELVAGTALDVGGVVFGEMFAGYLTQDYDAPGLPTIDGRSFGGSVDWNVTPLTTVSGSLERTVEESTLSASGFLSTKVRVSADHELRRNLILGAELGFTDQDYEGITRRDDRRDEVIEVGIGVTWLLNRHLHADVGYRFRTRDSSAARADYDNHVTSLTLRMQY